MIGSPSTTIGSPITVAIGNSVPTGKPPIGSPITIIGNSVPTGNCVLAAELAAMLRIMIAAS